MVSNIICLGSSILPSNLATSSGSNLSLVKNFLKVFLGILPPSITLTIAFNLSAGVDPSYLPFESILLTNWYASFSINSLYCLDPLATPGIALPAFFCRSIK